MKIIFQKILQLSLPVILLLIGLYLVPLKIFEPNLSKIMGDMGDARFNNYILEHGHKFLHGKVKNYWDVPMMYPYKNVIAFSDNLLGSMPIYSFFRTIGNDRETSFQYWIISLFALNFIFCYWALKKWSENDILSVTAAYIFAFGIYNIGHFEHVQVFPKFIAPFVLYWFWSFLSTKHLKYFLFTSLGLVFQFYCGIYLGFFLIYALFFLFIAYFSVYKDWTFFKLFKNLKFSSFLIIIASISCILLSFLIIPYIEITKTTGMRHFEDIINSIPRPVSYFFTHIASSNWNFLTQHSQFKFPDWWSHFHFVGALPFIGIFISIFLLFSKKTNKVRKKIISFLLLTLLLNIIFCINIGGHTLYKIIYMFPGFSSMRSIDRIINIQILFFLLVFVFAFKELLSIYKGTKWLVFLLPLIAIIDNSINTGELKRFDKITAQTKVKDIETHIRSQYNSKFKAIAYMPIISKPADPNIHDKTIELQISSIMAAQSLNIPIVNAYTGHYPGNYMAFFDNLDSTTLSDWCKYTNGNMNDIQKINDIGKNYIDIKHIYLKATNGKFVSIDVDNNNLLIANKDLSLEWENFRLILLDNNKCSLVSFQNKFVTVENKNEIKANSNIFKESECFIIQNIDNNHIAIKAKNGNYLAYDIKSTLLTANSKTIGKNEIFEIIYK